VESPLSDVVAGATLDSDNAPPKFISSLCAYRIEQPE
jgi:hypothetical protein